MTALDSLTDLETDSTGKLKHKSSVIDLVRDGGAASMDPDVDEASGEASESGVTVHRRHLKLSSIMLSVQDQCVLLHSWCRSTLLYILHDSVHVSKHDFEQRLHKSMTMPA